MKLKSLDENSLIAEIIRDFSRDNAVLEEGIGDDAAVICCGGEQTLLTKDLLIEGTHFQREFHPPRLLGRKSLSVNISDIAAMGGQPEFALLGLGIPPHISPGWVEDFFSGFRSCSLEHKTVLIGGDLSRSQMAVVSVTVLGRARRVVKRSGASPGDLIYVSGTPGDASLGLELLKQGDIPKNHPQKSRLYQAFLDPRPRVELGLFLAENSLASAMMDLSDGISHDLPRLCRMSHAGAEIMEEMVPVSAVLKKHTSKPLSYAIHGGEDYELIFTVHPSKEKSVQEVKDKFRLSRIGHITASREIFLRRADGSQNPLRQEGFDHF